MRHDGVSKKGTPYFNVFRLPVYMCIENQKIRKAMWESNYLNGSNNKLNIFCAGIKCFESPGKLQFYAVVNDVKLGKYRYHWILSVFFKNNQISIKRNFKSWENYKGLGKRAFESVDWTNFHFNCSHYIPGNIAVRNHNTKISEIQNRPHQIAKRADAKLMDIMTYKIKKEFGRKFRLLRKSDMHKLSFQNLMFVVNSPKFFDTYLTARQRFNLKQINKIELLADMGEYDLRPTKDGINVQKPLIAKKLSTTDKTVRNKRRKKIRRLKKLTDAGMLGRFIPNCQKELKKLLLSNMVVLSAEPYAHTLSQDVDSENGQYRIKIRVVLYEYIKLIHATADILNNKIVPIDNWKNILKYIIQDIQNNNECILTTAERFNKSFHVTNTKDVSIAANPGLNTYYFAGTNPLNAIPANIKTREVSDLNGNLDIYSTVFSSVAGQAFLSQFSLERRCRLLQEAIHHSRQTVEDTIYQWHREPDKIIIHNNLKTWDELHDYVSKEYRKLKNPDFGLIIADEILAINGIKLENELTLEVPQTNYQLVEYGQQMNNCIGSYGKRVNISDKEQWLLGVYKNGKLTYNIEVYDNKLIQFHANRNGSPDPVDKEIVVKFLTEKNLLIKKFPSDYADALRYMTDQLHVEFRLPQEEVRIMGLAEQVGANNDRINIVEVPDPHGHD